MSIVPDKAPSVWDDYFHTYPNSADDGGNGDVACDSYHRWQDDIKIASDLELDFYRLFFIFNYVYFSCEANKNMKTRIF